MFRTRSVSISMVPGLPPLRFAPMSMLLMPAGLAFAVCLVLVPPLMWVARRVDLLDVPDGRRKTHAKPVPLIGGLAIFAAICVALAAARLLSADAAEWFRTSAVSLPGL